MASLRGEMVGLGGKIVSFDGLIIRWRPWRLSDSLPRVVCGGLVALLCQFSNSKFHTGRHSLWTCSLGWSDG